MVHGNEADNRARQTMAYEHASGPSGADPAAAVAPHASRSHIRVASGEDYAPTARELFGRVNIRFIDDRRPDANLTSADLDRCRLTRIAASAHHVRGEKVVEHSYDSDSIKILLQLTGEAHFEQAGTHIALQPSAWVAYDPTRPYLLANMTSVQQLMLQIPRHAVATKSLSSLEKPRWITDDGVGMPGIVAALMRATLVEVNRFNHTTRIRVGETLANLTLGLIEPDTETEDDGRIASLDLLRQRVQAYMAAHLERQTVDIDEIARRMGCSRRYIFRAFEAECTTPAQYLWELRLTRSRDLLAASSQARRSISDIGFACGFSSSSHFSRAFRHRFGCSPRAYRVDQHSH